MTKVLNFKTIIEQDEDKNFIVSIPSVPGCYSQGKSYEEALKNIKEALELCLEEAKENTAYAEKIVFPDEQSKQNFIGVIDLPIRFAF